MVLLWPSISNADIISVSSFTLCIIPAFQLWTFIDFCVRAAATQILHQITCGGHVQLHSWLISWNSFSSQTMHITLYHRCNLLTSPHNMDNIWKWLNTMSYSTYSAHLAVHGFNFVKSGRWHNFLNGIKTEQNPRSTFFTVFLHFVLALPLPTIQN